MWASTLNLKSYTPQIQVIYLLRQGASLGVNNTFLESPESLAPVEVARELQARKGAGIVNRVNGSRSPYSP